MSDRKLLLELWQDFSDSKEPLHALQYAGSLGEEARRRLGPKAKLVTTILASSHFEAMTIHYRLMSWGEYTTNQPWDHEPYPEEWLLEQQKAGLIRYRT